jgi:hypothetical protein
MAWAFYELLKSTGRGLALMALLFCVAEAALYGVTAVLSVLLLSRAEASPALDDATLTIVTRARFASRHTARHLGGRRLASRRRRRTATDADFRSSAVGDV